MGRLLKQQQGKYISNQQMKEFITVKAYIDLFRRLLISANARHTNLRDVLSYELHVSPSPCSPVHNDGSLRKPIKSDLASVLEMGIIAVQQVFQPQQTTFLFISWMVWTLYRCINPLEPAHLRAS